VPLNLLHISSHVVHHADISKCLQLGVGKIYTLPWPVEPVDSLFFFKQYWDLNSGPCTCLAGALPFEPQPYFALVFFPEGPHIFCSGWVGP
jgi:hypothetical protein